MEAKVDRGFLEVQDEKGSYRIPVGRRSRKCLFILDKKEGEYVRSLEIDLFTGYVYYSVDNETSGGLSYYYDMSSKKVGHYFIHRYLRLAIQHGTVVPPLEREVLEKLPCENWQEELKKLPGWEEAIEHRLDLLLLPAREVWQAGIPEGAETWTAAAGRGEGSKEQADSGSQGKSPLLTAGFTVRQALHSVGKREYVFQWVRSPGMIRLLHRDAVAGSEFFGENGEYERILSEKESFWLDLLLTSLTGRIPEAEQYIESAAEEILPGRRDSFVEKVVLSCEDGSSRTIAVEADKNEKAAALLLEALRGLVRREIEVV